MSDRATITNLSSTTSDQDRSRRLAQAYRLLLGLGSGQERAEQRPEAAPGDTLASNRRERNARSSAK